MTSIHSQFHNFLYWQSMKNFASPLIKGVLTVLYEMYNISICARCSPEDRTLNLFSLHWEIWTLTIELRDGDKKSTLVTQGLYSQHIYTTFVVYGTRGHSTHSQLWMARHAVPTTRLFYSTKANNAILMKGVWTVLYKMYNILTCATCSLEDRTRNLFSLHRY